MCRTKTDPLKITKNQQCGALQWGFNVRHKNKATIGKIKITHMAVRGRSQRICISIQFSKESTEHTAFFQEECSDMEQTVLLSY